MSESRGCPRFKASRAKPRYISGIVCREPLITRQRRTSASRRSRVNVEMWYLRLVRLWWAFPKGKQNGICSKMYISFIEELLKYIQTYKMHNNFLKKRYPSTFQPPNIFMLLLKHRLFYGICFCLQDNFFKELNLELYLGLMTNRKATSHRR